MLSDAHVSGKNESQVFSVPAEVGAWVSEKALEVLILWSRVVVLKGLSVRLHVDLLVVIWGLHFEGPFTSDKGPMKGT